jgi:hypothetical protein
MALSVVACDREDEKMSNNGHGTESLAVLGAELELEFPPSARLLGVLRSPGGMDDAVRVKLEVDPSELPMLLGQTHIEAEAFAQGTGGLLGPDKDFWDPHQAASVRTGQAKRAGGRVLNVGIDDSRAGSAVIYLVEHGT